MKLSEDEIEKGAILIAERGEVLYSELQRYIKSNDRIVRNTPLMSYIYASLKMIQDTYETLVDMDPHNNIDYELKNLVDNIGVLIKNIKEHQVKLQGGTPIWDTLDKG